MLYGLIALLLAQFIGGALSPLFVKLGIREFPPILFTALRFIIALVIFAPFYFLQKENKFNKGELKELTKTSIFFFFNATLFGIGIQYTTVIASQILYALFPVFVIILSKFMLHESITKEKIIGLSLAFIGTLVLIFQSFDISKVQSFGLPLGNILILCAVVSWSLYFVLSKKNQQKYSPVTITFFNFVITSLILSLIIPVEYTVRPFVLNTITLLGIVSLFATALFSSVFMIFLIQYGIKKTSAFTASLFQYLGPLFASLTAIPFLQEKISSELVLSGGIILVGVFYASTYNQIRRYVKFGRIKI